MNRVLKVTYNKIIDLVTKGCPATAAFLNLNIMENYNQTTGNNNRDSQQSDQPSIKQNIQESQSQDYNEKNNSPQGSKEKKPVYIKDMPEIKPEVNQGGL
jgi:hypothetical protein